MRCIDVGTTSPSSKLHVFGGTHTIESGSNQSITIFKGLSGKLGYVGTSVNGGLASGIADGDVVLRSEGGSSLHLSTDSTSKFTLTASGNVGIGTSAPASKLSVISTNAITETFYVKQPANNNYGIMATFETRNADNTAQDGPRILFVKGSSSNKQWASGVQPYGNNGFSIWEDAGTVSQSAVSFGAERFTVASGGNVGIHTI